MKIKIIPIIAIIAVCFGLGYGFGCLIAPKGAKVSGVVSGAHEVTLVAKKLNLNKFEVLDTIKTNSSGAFSYKVDVKKGDPEFIYLFNGENRIASLILQKGDKVKVDVDANGANYSVTGSEESVKLAEVERVETDFNQALADITAKLDKIGPASDEAAPLRREMTRKYVDYYRDRVKYVMSNPKSLTVIPVLYQVVGENLPVFGQTTDAMHFRSCTDSLMTVYPDSRYVKALAEETARRENLLSLSARLSNAQQLGYIDIDLKDITGKSVKLSDVDAKVVMVYFWAASEAGQKMFNLDVLKPVYEDYRSRGLEIYGVSLDTDKTLWATTVKNQDLEWINVCDVAGIAATAYNVPSLPTVYFIVDGEIKSDVGVRDEATLRRYLKSQLR